MTASSNDPSAAPSIGLRDRRRRETCREIATAAVDLFEKQGVQRTTVDEIAEAAGISPRTFFRYAETKEHAIFVDDHDGEALVDRTRREVAAGATPMATIERAQLEMLDAFDAEADEHHSRVLRARRLIIVEPSLLAVALTRDEECTAELTRVVVETTASGAGASGGRAGSSAAEGSGTSDSGTSAPGASRPDTSGSAAEGSVGEGPVGEEPVGTVVSPSDELHARALVTALNTSVRLAFDEWARRAERGEQASVRALYTEIRAGLAAYFGAASPTD